MSAQRLYTIDYERSLTGSEGVPIAPLPKEHNHHRRRARVGQYAPVCGLFGFGVRLEFGRLGLFHICQSATNVEQAGCLRVTTHLPDEEEDSRCGTQCEEAVEEAWQKGRESRKQREVGGQPG